MVASLGTIPLANPLQNPVLSGWQQMQQTQYAPLQMMSAPLQAIAMANMYGMRGLNYAAMAGLNTAKEQVQPTVAAKNMGQAGVYNATTNELIPSQSNNYNSQATLAQQKGAFIQQQINAGVPQTQAMMNADRAFASANQGIGSYQNAVNNGYSGAMPVIPVSPAMPAAPVYTGTSVPQSLGASPPSQPSVINGGAIPPLNPALTNSLSTLQQQIANQNQANPQAATAPPPTWAQSSGQAQQQALPQGNFAQWSSSDQDNYIQKNNTPPPLPPGTAITKEIDPKTIARINGLAPTAQAINFMQQGLNNPQISPYIGNSVQAIAARKSAQALSLVGKAPPAYSDYLSFEKNAQALVNDTIATTQTGSRSFGMMQQFAKVFDPSSQVTLAQAKGSINSAGTLLYDEGKTYVGSPYLPGLRTAAYNGVKLLSKYGFDGGQTSGAAQTASPNQTLTFGNNSIPSSVVSQYAQKYFNGNTADASTYLSQHFGGQ